MNKLKILSTFFVLLGLFIFSQDSQAQTKFVKSTPKYKTLKKVDQRTGVVKTKTPQLTQKQLAKKAELQNQGRKLSDLTPEQQAQKKAKTQNKAAKSFNPYKGKTVTPTATLGGGKAVKAKSKLQPKQKAKNFKAKKVNLKK